MRLIVKHQQGKHGSIIERKERIKTTRSRDLIYKSKPLYH